MTTRAPVESPGRLAFPAKVSFVLIGEAAAPVDIPPVGFLVGPLLRKVTQQWRAVGEATKFAVGETSRVVFLDPSPLPWTGATAETAAWLKRISDTEFVAFQLDEVALPILLAWRLRQSASKSIRRTPAHQAI